MAVGKEGEIWKVTEIINDGGHINERKINRAPINIQAAIRTQLQEYIDKQRGKKRKRNGEEEEDKREEATNEGNTKRGSEHKKLYTTRIRQGNNNSIRWIGERSTNKRHMGMVNGEKDTREIKTPWNWSGGM